MSELKTGQTQFKGYDKERKQLELSNLKRRKWKGEKLMKRKQIIGAN